MSKITQCLFNQKLAKKQKDSSDCRILQVNMPARTQVDIEFNNITMTVTEGFTTRSPVKSQSSPSHTFSKDVDFAEDFQWNFEKKTILNGVSGLFRSGHLTAIMGPSGAGKSSLLNALTGFATEGVSGRIRAGDSICEFNNQCTSSLKAYQKKSSYILQDDRLNPLFTVAELMRFAADMKLGDNLVEELKLTVIKEVLMKLGLLGTENTRCANLSGGQKKRLSIAVELLDNPPVMYLDEPTTGLDSLTSVQCMTMLKALARDGRTIVCTIHQPPASLYSMFDQVYMLADGMCIYNGPSENTVPYLASMGLQCPMYHNPADYILEIATGEYGNFNEILAKKCSQTTHTIVHKVPQPRENGAMLCDKISVMLKRPHELYRFNVLFRRCIIQQYRDWTVTHLKVFLHICIGVLLGLLYIQSGQDGSKTVSNMGYLLVSVVYLCYTSLMPAVLKFPLELSVLKKENFNNWYNLKTYYAAALLTSIPLQISYSVVYSIPSYLISGQPLEWARFTMFVLALAQVALLADAVGNVIGTCVNPVNGTFFGAILTCMMLLFTGFLVLFQHMHWIMVYVSHLSFLKYAYEALTLALYAYGRPPLECPPDVEYCHMRFPSVILKEFSIKTDNYWTDITIMLIELIILRILAFFTLRRCMKRSA